MVFEVGITLFIHLMCMFFLFTLCVQAAREHVGAQQSRREEGQIIPVDYFDYIMKYINNSISIVKIY